MTILARIDADLTAAMKRKDELELSSLRLIRSALKNKQIDLGHDPTDDEAQAVLRTLTKQYTDALADFERAKRTDLATRQRAELEIVKRYLPSGLPEEELERLIQEAVAVSGARSPSEVGKAMGAAMKVVAGRADGNAVRAIVERILTPP